jgi:hypothetical protein
LSIPSGNIAAKDEGISAEGKHPSWKKALIGAVLVGGIVAIASSDDRTFIRIGSPAADDAAPHHPHGRHRGWEGHK